MAVGLGEFLRQSLRLGALASVTLEQEVALASEYLAIEQVRFGDRLAVAISVAPDVAGCALPPLLLQPLVENAIKHGVAGLIDGGTVGVTAASDGGQCEVVIRNGYDPDTRSRPGTGTGLVNVRARLATHFGAQGTLDVRMDETLFTVRVRWPMAEPEPARTAEVSA